MLTGSACNDDVIIFEAVPYFRFFGVLTAFRKWGRNMWFKNYYNAKREGKFFKVLNGRWILKISFKLPPLRLLELHIFSKISRRLYLFSCIFFFRLYIYLAFEER